MSSGGILMLTSNYAPGYKVTKVLGLVYGINVRSRSWEETSWPGCGRLGVEKSTNTPK